MTTPNQFGLKLSDNDMKAVDTVYESQNNYSRYQDEYNKSVNQVQSSELVYFDAQENLSNQLCFDFCSAELHTIYALANTKALDIVQSYAVPTVSADSSLELLEVHKLEANMAINNYHPIIIGTGASLAITGNKQDFIPNIYQEVTSLKLGGMAAGAKIDVVGNVAWSFPCDNGDQMVIVTKYYHVPTARTRLLSPQ